MKLLNLELLNFVRRTPTENDWMVVVYEIAELIFYYLRKSVKSAPSAFYFAMIEWVDG